MTGSKGDIALYLFSDEKTKGGGSSRYACLSVEDGEAALLVCTREPHKTEAQEVSMRTLGDALLRAFAHVQAR